ncbi:hypothetical protein V6N13_067751 [Hibiscus sabdariffa]
MASNSRQLRLVFFPHLAHGHLIPTVDMARLFARLGVKVTVATTPLNALLFAHIIQRDKESGFDICARVMKFAAEEVGLPPGCENASSLTSQQMTSKFLMAVDLLRLPLEELLEELRPDCLVADAMFPWATDIAIKFGIPRLVFHGTSCFALCVAHSLVRHEPFRNVASESELFDVPALPHQIKMTRSQLPDYMKEKTETVVKRLMNQVMQSDSSSYGVVVNSFHELEPAYSEHYSKVMGRKAWFVGPVSLCNNDKKDKAERGNAPSISTHECLRWLDSKKPNSVLYVCFGSIFRTRGARLNEIAKGLEASGQDFIWVVRKVDDDEEKEEWLPEGFEERIKGKGLIVRGWAAQVAILEHEAVGGFMSHCGWNSTIESIAAGVPMVTWPLCAEQFSNEKLVTDVLKIGVGVGAKVWRRWTDESVAEGEISMEDIERAVSRVMVGEEGDEMRNRARELKNVAREAVDEGGSSYSDMNALLDDLRMNCLKP